MSLAILTICCGRTDYLKKQLTLLLEEKQYIDQHLFVVNGFKLDNKELLDLLQALGSEVVFIDKLQPVGATIEHVRSHLKTTHVLKLDDDALPVSRDFLKLICKVIELKPNSSFSPFPVGLLQSLGGPKLKEGANWSALYIESEDVYLTIRPVNHLGGFCRVSPRENYDQISLDPETHSEDKEFSVFCNNLNQEMFYLDSGIVVEHAETYRGQVTRNKAYVTSIKKIRKDIKI